MNRFVDRVTELAFLDELLGRRSPGPAQLALLYGRRRVGKTVLLRHWVEQQQSEPGAISFTYWTAEKEQAALQRRKLYARLLDIPPSRVPYFDSWQELWAAAAQLLGNRRHILILDELPYAADNDPAMLSALQHAWDQFFKDSRLIIVLCGSHVRTMEMLMTRQSPLFGRMTGQWHLEPLAFHTLKEFFPEWSAEERVAAFAIVGGIPAYLEWFDPQRSLVENIRDVILSPGSMFIAEPHFLLYDEVRQPQSYLAALKAIGAGFHTLREISNESLIGSAHLPSYLATLQELRLVERRIPVTVAPALRRKSRQGRYHLSDPYFRFYFRFLDPYSDLLPLDSPRVLHVIRENLRAFVGQTAFEELAREWVRRQGRAESLPLTPDEVGSHWSRRVQVDVVGVNWKTREILLGECKWGGVAVDEHVVRQLVMEKTPKVLLDLDASTREWRIHYAFFARAGFTARAIAEAQRVGAMLVDLQTLDRGLE
jgi:hypothetical protein